jgi:hypothetical protein
MSPARIVDVMRRGVEDGDIVRSEVVRRELLTDKPTTLASNQGRNLRIQRPTVAVGEFAERVSGLHIHFDRGEIRHTEWYTNAFSF